MSKNEFIKLFATKAGLTQKDAREVTGAFFETIFEVLKNGGEISPVQGVKFMTVHHDARKARNPQTGEAIDVAAKDVPKVKFGASVKALFV